MKPSIFSSDTDPTKMTQPSNPHDRLVRGAKRGAIIGFAVGLLTLVGVLSVARQCLPFYISFPPPPWPWYCLDPTYKIIGYLAFPVNLLTNDLARAILLAPLALSLYILIGALLGLMLGKSRSSTLKS